MATLYYVIYPSAQGTPSVAQIKAGQNASGAAATAAGSETARTTTGVETFASAATGLTAGTSYKIAFVWSDGSNDSSVSESSAFVTDSLFSYNGSGTITFSGTATTAVLKLYGYSGSGTLTFSGAGTTAYVPPGATTYSYSGSGSITLSGTATTTTAKIYAYSGSGSLAYSGAATTSYTPGLVVYTYEGSGSIAFSGSAATFGNVISLEPSVGVGGTSSKSSRRKQRVILVERVEDVEDFVEQIEEAVREEPKVKSQLRKAKKTKPASVENTIDNAQAWIDYYQSIAQALQDQQRAKEIEEALQRGAEMLNAMLARQETVKLMAIEKKRRDEEEFLLMLMAA